jgi:hypothetical protein
MANGKHKVQELAEGAELDVRSYSGRGMYGRECLAIEGSSAMDIMASLLERISEEGEDAAEAASDLSEALRRSSQDSMGRDMVLYFPGIPFVSEDADEEDNDEEDNDEDDEEEDEAAA